MDDEAVFKFNAKQIGKRMAAHVAAIITNEVDILEGDSRLLGVACQTATCAIAGMFGHLISKANNISEERGTELAVYILTTQLAVVSGLSVEQATNQLRRALKDNGFGELPITVREMDLTQPPVPLHRN